MMQVVCTVDDAEAKASFGKLLTMSGTVISRAANRSVTTGKKAIKQETAKIYEVRQTDVEHDLKVTRASSVRPWVVLHFESAHKNLFTWSTHGRSVVTPGYPVRSSSAYNPDPEVYRAHVMKAHSGGIELGGSRKPFMQITRSGFVGLFRRTAEGSRQIEGVAAPALTQVMKNKKVYDRFMRDTSEMFAKRMIHESEHILNKR